jgi:hypothetical protein
MASPEVKRYTLTDAPPAIEVTAEPQQREPSIRRHSALRYPASHHAADNPGADSPVQMSALETGYKAAFSSVESDGKIDKIGVSASARVFL